MCYVPTNKPEILRLKKKKKKRLKSLAVFKYTRGRCFLFRLQAQMVSVCSCEMFMTALQLHLLEEVPPRTELEFSPAKVKPVL